MELVLTEATRALAMVPADGVQSVWPPRIDVNKRYQAIWMGLAGGPGRGEWEIVRG